MLFNIAAMGRNREFLFITCAESHIKIAPTNRFVHIGKTKFSLPETWGILIRTIRDLVNIESLSSFLPTHTFSMEREQSVYRKILMSGFFVLLLSWLWTLSLEKKRCICLFLKPLPWNCISDWELCLFQWTLLAPNLIDVIFYSPKD